MAIAYSCLAATCPVRALEQWLELADSTSGPIFRPVDRHGTIGAQRLTAQSVTLLVKHSAAAAGLSVDDFAGHTLRAGRTTSAAAARVSEYTIIQQTGHTSVAIVQRSIRDADLFAQHAAGRVGL